MKINLSKEFNKFLEEHELLLSNLQLGDKKMKNKKQKGIYAGVLLVILFIVGTIVIMGYEPTENRIYDVNRNGVINFQDAGLCYVYYHNGVDNEYGNLLYDVNFDGVVDVDDAIEIWEHRDQMYCEICGEIITRDNFWSHPHPCYINKKEKSV